MTELKFQLDRTDCQLEIQVDSAPVDYVISNDCIIINHNIGYGFHMVKFKLLDSNIGKVQIKSGSVDGVDFRQTLYTMFVWSGSERKQTTILTERDSELYLPFANPISWWLSNCTEKIPGQYFHSKMYEELSVYYPESIDISKKYPKLVQDFFKVNMNFHVHSKKLLDHPYYNNSVPYANLPKKIDYDETKLFDELMSESDYLKQTARIPSQHTYNKISSPNRWLVNDLIMSPPDEYNLERKFLIDRTRVPILYSIFEQLDLDVIVHAFLGILGPGEFASPHIDDYVNNELVIEKFGGCSQIYIPINFKKGNYFKLNNVGLLPTDRPILINNHNFTHALINDSDEYRFGIAIVGSPVK